MTESEYKKYLNYRKRQIREEKRKRFVKESVDLNNIADMVDAAYSMYDEMSEINANADEDFWDYHDLSYVDDLCDKLDQIYRAYKAGEHINYNRATEIFAAIEEEYNNYI